MCRLVSIYMGGPMSGFSSLEELMLCFLQASVNEKLLKQNSVNVIHDSIK